MNRQQLRIAIVVLAVISGLIHWSLLIGFFDVPFLLNGIGYFTLAALFAANPPFVAERTRLFHYVFIAFALVTIVAWIAVGAREPLGYFDKLVEILLVAALWLHLQRLEPQAQPSI